MSDKNFKSCLVTISDAEFSIATEVLLYSFHKYNPGFSGEVLVIADDLPEAERRRLERFGPVGIETPDPRLLQAVLRLQESEPRLKNIHRRLFSLEAFRLTGYDRVVYLDSDIYCAGDLTALFHSTEPLLACPDGFTYGDRILELLAEGDTHEPSPRYGKPFQKSFNAGVLSIGPPVLGEATYLRLLEWLQPEKWQQFSGSKFSDQMVLNLAFEDRFAELQARYNYMVFIEEYQKSLEPVSFLDARLVHFAGEIKPWFCFDPQDLAVAAPQFLKFIDVWRELLEEARAGEEDVKTRIYGKYTKQKNWIRSYNADKPVPTGRLY